MRSPADRRTRLATGVVLLAALLGAARPAAAEGPTIRQVRPGRPGSPTLYVSFNTPVPAPADVRGKDRWQVQIVTTSGLTAMTVTDAREVPDDYAVTGLVTIALSAPLPATFERVEVRYTVGSAPMGVLAAPKPASSGVSPVDDPKKADVYLSGILLPAAEAKPLYTIDSRGSYQIWADASGARVWDVSGSAKADKRENADLDSYVFGANYHRIAQGGRRVDLHWFSGAEMNSKARVTNLVTAPRLVLPWTHHRFRKDAKGVTTLVASYGATVDAAVEAGVNLRNLYSDPAEEDNGDGSGGILRLAPGLTLYAVKPKAGFLNRVGVTARYLVRLPATDELFLETRKSRGAGKDPIPQLNRRARHFVQIATAFMLTDYAGIELKYGYGSEPPAFKLTGHNGAVGLVIKFRQTDRIR